MELRCGDVLRVSDPPCWARARAEVIYPLDQAKDLLRFYRGWSTAARMKSGRMQPWSGAPRARSGTSWSATVGDRRGREGAAATAVVRLPYRRLGRARPYVAVQDLLTVIFQPGRLKYWKAGFVRALGNDAIEALVDFFAISKPGLFCDCNRTSGRSREPRWSPRHRLPA